jgi:hypothetical protein
MASTDHGTAPLTRQQVLAAAGPVDEIVLAEIIEMGATIEELAEAVAWTTNDEALINSGKPLATGRVSRLVELLARESEEDDELRG